MLRSTLTKTVGATLLAAVALTLVSVASASSPAAATGSVSNLSTPSVRLHGSVAPNGESTSWYFEFGPTTSYGTRTATQSAGSGQNATNVQTNVSGLSVATMFHYRL